MPANPAAVLRNPLMSKNLAVDIAIGTSEASICEAYELQHHELQQILNNPQFVVELSAVQTALKDNGELFKLKCQMQSEHLIDRSWKMIHNEMTSDAVRADLIKSTVRWAGYEKSGNGDGSGSGGGGKFSVNINLSNAHSHEPRNITIDGGESSQ